MVEVVHLPRQLKPEEFATWDELFSTEQVPPDRMAEILRDNPDFAEYRRKRHGPL